MCDNGYANSEGFLTPFKGVRYHLKEWGPANERPRDKHEMFNLRHTKARNIIERAFAVLKMRWGILRSPSFYPLKVQIRLIMCCFLLHNFIRGEMAVDPIEQQLEGLFEHFHTGEEPEDIEYVDVVEPSSEWNQYREAMARDMWAQVFQLGAQYHTHAKVSCQLSLCVYNVVMINLTWLQFFLQGHHNGANMVDVVGEE